MLTLNWGCQFPYWESIQHKTFSQILIGCPTLGQEYCKLICWYWKTMRGQLWTLTCPIVKPVVNAGEKESASLEKIHIHWNCKYIIMYIILSRLIRPSEWPTKLSPLCATELLQEGIFCFVDRAFLYITIWCVKTWIETNWLAVTVKLFEWCSFNEVIRVWVEVQMKEGTYCNYGPSLAGKPG